jgi:hypothetical protein
MKNYIQIIVLVLTFVLGAYSSFAVVITGFSNSEFAVDAGISDFSAITQNATSTTAIGTDQNILAGTFTPIDITGFSTIELSALVSGTNPNGAFTIDLFNTDFTQSRIYSGATTSLTSSLSTITLSFVSQSAAFNDIGGFQFGGQGSGSSLNITFGSIAAVPEPSTWVLLAGGLAIILLLRRRRA